MYRCDSCGWETTVMTVRCKGIGCGRAGTMRAVLDEPAATNVPIVPKAATAPPNRHAVTRPVVPKAPVTRPNITGANPPAPLTPPTRVVQTGLPQMVPAVVAPPGNVAAVRAPPGEESAAVLDVFERSGVWMRAVQFKNCQCVTAPDIRFDASTRSVSGLFADSWTYAHPSIGQHLFQMHPTEGKRAVALIVDWTQTDDRYVSYSVTDASSNKTFLPKEVAQPPEQTARDMAAMRRELAGRNSVDHNEVRTCQIQKRALIGLIWNPILRPTPLSDGGATWEDSKAKFQAFMRTLQAAGVAPNGLPVFTYEVSGGMTLTFLDFLA